jgi:hypothetical protein
MVMHPSCGTEFGISLNGFLPYCQSQPAFWKPEWVPFSTWHEHAPFAFSLMEVLKPRSVIELGTHYGFSFLAFCQAASQLQIPTRCYAVDTWKGDEHAGYYGEEIYYNLKRHHDSMYGSFSRLVRSTFDEALLHFPNLSVDLLHIDGRHFYEDVKRDFENWRPKLSDRAVVLFHDINVRELTFGVWKYWNEIKKEFDHFEFDHAHGLGVLCVGTVRPAALDFLLHVSAESAVAVRKVYARLGTAIAQEFRERQTKELEAELSQATLREREARTEVNAAREELSGARAEAVRAIEEASKVREEAAQATKVLAQLREDTEQAKIQAEDYLKGGERLKEENNRVREELQHVKTDLEAARLSGARVAEEFLQVQGSAHRTEAELELTRDRLARETKSLAEAQQQIEQEKENASRAEEGQASTARLQLETQKEADVAKVELMRARQLAAQTGDELLAVKENADQAELRLSAILNSTSWRLSTPVRRILERSPAFRRVGRRIIKFCWWTLSGQLMRRLRSRNAAAIPAPLLQKAATADARPGVPLIMSDFEARIQELQKHAADFSTAIANHSTAIANHSTAIANHETRLQQMSNHGARLAATETALQDEQAQRVAVHAIVHHDQNRIDAVLSTFEGVSPAAIESFHLAKDSAEYKAAFDTSMPLISVCVATMDRAELLVERAINSLRNQTYSNLQIVVVGDGCTDDTEARLARIKDSRLSFINLPFRGPYPRPGVDRWRVAGTNAMNHALSLCEGEFITHLDDDDRATPQRIELLLQQARERRADFLWHPFWHEAHDGTWYRIGNGRLECGQVTTSSIFYHKYLKKWPWDVHAYRIGEPGDWNRIRKIKFLRPTLHFVDEMLLYHHKEQQNQRNMLPHPHERFLP